MVDHITTYLARLLITLLGDKSCASFRIAEIIAWLIDVGEARFEDAKDVPKAGKSKLEQVGVGF